MRELIPNKVVEGLVILWKNMKTALIQRLLHEPPTADLEKKSSRTSRQGKEEQEQQFKPLERLLNSATKKTDRIPLTSYNCMKDKDVRTLLTMS